MFTISGGQSIGDGSYINHSYGGYPFIGTFILDESTMPLQECRLGVYSWDCDEDATEYWYTSEYDCVYVNDVLVGVLTGQDQIWKTSYFNVPLSALQIGENTVTIYVGHRDNTTGQTVLHTDDWLLKVNWLSIQCDGGKSAEAPDKFILALQYAIETVDGVECGVTATIESSEIRSYIIEYSLVDMNTGSPTYNQIIADDEESVSGTHITSTGHFFLGTNPPKGDYLIQATLRDPLTNEVYAYVEKHMNLGQALKSTCDHKRLLSTDTYLRTALRKLNKEDPDYDTQHERADIYNNVCSKCGATFQIYGDWEREDHADNLCDCGYSKPGYNPIHSATLTAVDQPYAGSDFVVTVVTHSKVVRIKAVNNNGVTMRDIWISQDNGDDTRTWTRIYKADLPANGRYWTIMGYNSDNRVVGTAQTNLLDILNGKALEPLEQTETVTTYTIKVIDKKSSTPIAGASVVLHGQSGITRNDGTVVFDRALLTGGNLIVNKVDYTTRSISSYSISNNRSMDVIILSKDKVELIPRMCNEDSITTGKAQINNAAHLNADIRVEGSVPSNMTITGYELLQNDTILATSTDGSFTLDNGKFAKGAPIVAKMLYINATGLSRAITKTLNITVVSVDAVSLIANLPEVPLMGGFSFASRGFDLLDGISWDFRKGSSTYGAISGNPNFKYELDNYELRGGIGLTVDKSFVKMNSSMRDKQKKAGMLLRGEGVEFEPAFCMCFKFNETGVYQTTGAFGISLAATKEFSKTVPILSIPISLGIKFAAGGSASIGNIGYNYTSQQWVAPELGIGLNAEVTGTAGVGVSCASVGIYGKLGANMPLTTPFVVPPRFTGTCTINGEMGIYLKVNLGWFLKYDGKFRVLPSEDDTSLGRFYIGIAQPLDQESIIANTYNTLERGYIQHRSDWMTGAANANMDENTAISGIRMPKNALRIAANSGLTTDFSFSSASGESLSYDTLQKSVYSWLSPQLASAGDDALMLYVDDDGDMFDSANYSHVVYSLWNSSGWDSPLRVNKGDLMEDLLSVASDGQELYIAYCQANRLFTNDELPQENDSQVVRVEKTTAALSSLEIVVSHYVPGTGFETVCKLTHDKEHDSMPVITVLNGLPVVAWVRNPSNQMFGLTGESQLMMMAMQADGTWIMNTLQTNGCAVLELSVGTLSGQAVVCATLDADNNLETSDDRTMTVLLPDGGAYPIATGICGNPLFAEIAGQHALTWYDQGRVLSITSVQGEVSVLADTTYAIPANFRIAKYKESPMLLFTLNNNEGDIGGSDLYGLIVENGTGNFVRLTETSGYVDTFDFLQQSNGIYFAFVLRNASNINGEIVFSDDLCATMSPHRTHLIMGDLQYDMAELRPNGTITLSAQILNNGTEPISRVYIVVTGGASTFQTDVDVSIPAGEVGTVSFEYALPGTLQGALTVACSAFQNTVAPDDTQTLSLEFDDFGLTADQLILADDNHLIFCVSNLGTSAGECLLSVHASSVDGEKLYSRKVSLPSLHVLNDYIPVDDLLSRTKDNILYVKLSDISMDENPDNNAVVVSFSIYEHDN